MTKRFVWPALGLLALVGVIVAINSASAQRKPEPPPPPPGGVGGGVGGGFGMAFPPMPGRFVSAYASASEVVVLDTATGKVYRWEKKDFLKGTDLPKNEGFGGGLIAPFDPPAERFKEKNGRKDKEPRRDDPERRKEEPDRKKDEEKPRRDDPARRQDEPDRKKD